MSEPFRRPERASRLAGTELRKLRAPVVLAMAVLVAGVLYWARVILIPVAAALLLAFLLTPLVTQLHRRGVARSIAVVLVVLLAFSVLGGIGWVLTVQAWSLAEELPLYRGNIRQRIADLRKIGRGPVLDRLQRLADEVVGEIQKEDPATAKPKREPQPVVVVPGIQERLRQLSGLVDPFVTAALVVALVAFMLLRQAELRNRVLRLMGGSLPVATRALDEAGQRISHYLLTLSMINGSFGLAVGLGLFLVGLPYAVLWGFLAGVLRFVPYVGAWLAALLPLTLALAVFEGWLEPLAVLGLFLLLEPLIFLVLEPLLYQARTGVSDVAILIAVLFWAWLWGPVGLLLATPLTVCLVVLGKYVPELSFLVVLMGDEPALEPHLRYYQRLLAEDEDEAADIVEAYGREHPVEQVADDLLVPALVRLKRDRASGAVAEEDARFVLERTREILDELALPPAAPALPLPDAAPVRLLGCPARDEADELGLVMLRPLLERLGCEVELASPEMLTAEVVALAVERRPALLCVTAIAPGGLAHARYLVMRLRAALPEATILVGRWGGDGRVTEARARLVAAGANEVGASLTVTRDQVRGFIPILARLEAVGEPVARIA